MNLFNPNDSNITKTLDEYYNKQIDEKKNKDIIEIRKILNPIYKEDPQKAFKELCRDAMKKGSKNAVYEVSLTWRYEDKKLNKFDKKLVKEVNNGFCKELFKSMDEIPALKGKIKMKSETCIPGIESLRYKNYKANGYNSCKIQFK